MSETLATPTPVDLLPGDEVPQEPGYDAERYGVEDGWARDQQLRLRPTIFEGYEHPDRRPCPPWCASARYPGHEHEILAHQPTSARHNMNAPVTSRASLYRGRKDRLPGGERVECAVFVCAVEQVGQAMPVIELALRTYDRAGALDEDRLFNQCFRMSATDAEELIVVLSYMIRLARAGEDAREAAPSL